MGGKFQHFKSHDGKSLEKFGLKTLLYFKDFEKLIFIKIFRNSSKKIWFTNWNSAFLVHDNWEVAWSYSWRYIANALRSRALGYKEMECVLNTLAHISVLWSSSSAKKRKFALASRGKHFLHSNVSTFHQVRISFHVIFPIPS